MTVKKWQYKEEIIEKAKKGFGKKYTEQVGRKPGKGPGKIVPKRDGYYPPKESVSEPSKPKGPVTFVETGGKVDYSKIKDVKVEDIDMHDYPDFANAFMASGTYAGRQMTDKELDIMNSEHNDFVYKQIPNDPYGGEREPDDMEKAKKRFGKPFTQQPGRKPGKGKGKIVPKKITPPGPGDIGSVRISLTDDDLDELGRLYLDDIKSGKINIQGYELWVKEEDKKKWEDNLGIQPSEFEPEEDDLEKAKRKEMRPIKGKKRTFMAPRWVGRTGEEIDLPGEKMPEEEYKEREKLKEELGKEIAERKEGERKEPAVDRYKEMVFDVGTFRDVLDHFALEDDDFGFYDLIGNKEKLYNWANGKLFREGLGYDKAQEKIRENLFDWALDASDEEIKDFQSRVLGSK